MKVRICYTIEADEEFRRALAYYLGKDGKLATREQIQDYMRQEGEGGADEIVVNYRMGHSEEEDDGAEEEGESGDRVRLIHDPMGEKGEEDA